MSKVDAFASQPHYLDHLAPVWRALHPTVRGQFVVPPTLVQLARDLGVDRASPTRADRTRPVLVASYVDERATHPSPVILLEHGAGQHYVHATSGPRVLGDPGTTRRRQRLVAYLGPNERTVDRFTTDHPGVEGYVVGCPKLADLARHRSDRRQVRWAPGYAPVVTFTWHWDAPVIAEARSAFDHWATTVLRSAAVLSDHGFVVQGHAHPKAWPQIGAWYRRHGIRRQADPRRVLVESDVLVADNTSLIFEACALDLPVVLLDAPWYRTDVEHGLRFWRWANVGFRLRPEEAGTAALVSAVTAAVSWPDALREIRAACTAEVYAHIDDVAASRAAMACADVASRITPKPGGSNVAGHDPFKGRPAVKPRIAPPSGDELRLRIVGWFEFHRLTPNAEQVAAWHAMNDDELAAAVRGLDQLSASDIERLRRAVDVTGMTTTGAPPEPHEERIAWIGDDVDRARVALADEQQRPESRQRSTVLDHIAKVLSAGT